MAAREQVKKARRRYGRRTIEGQPLHRDPYAPGISKSERRKRLSSFRGDLATRNKPGRRGRPYDAGGGLTRKQRRKQVSGGLLERTQSRAKRLGVELGSEVSRGQAVQLRRQLAARRRGQNVPGGLKPARPGGFKGPVTGGGGGKPMKELPPPTTKVNEKPRRFSRQLVDLGYSAVNPTKAPAGGAERGGRRYRLKADPESKKFVHVYGRGKKAERIWLRGSSPWQAGYQQKYGAQVKDLMQPGAKKRKKSGTRAPA